MTSTNLPKKPTDSELLDAFRAAALALDNKRFDDLSRDMKIKDMGIDSVALFEIFGEIEREFNVQFNDDDLAELVTLGDLIKLLRTQLL